MKRKASVIVMPVALRVRSIDSSPSSFIITLEGKELRIRFEGLEDPVKIEETMIFPSYGTQVKSNTMFWEGIGRMTMRISKNG